LAKEIVTHSKGAEYVVLGQDGYVPPNSNIRSEPLFKSSGAYQPGLFQNFLTLLRLLKPDRGIDIYHFFYAPGRLSSIVLRTLLHFKKQKTVHTLCSRPKDYRSTRKLLFADRIVALSEEARKELELADCLHVETIYPCIRVPSQEEISKVDPSKWSWVREGAKAVVLYPGDYEFSGGHEVLLACLPAVLREEPEVKVVFACRRKTKRAKEIEDEVKTKVREAGFESQVVFLNEVDDMLSLIRACDLTVFPAKSLYRKMDLPLTLLESLALERPLVVSNLAPLAELVTQDVGFVVRQGDREGLAERILELVRNPGLRALLGEKGRKRVEEEYSPRKAALQYEEIYRELISDGSEKQTRRYYDRFSAWYEERRRDGYHALIDDLQASVVKECLVGQKVLEVGSGTGLLMERLGTKAGFLVGIDLSKEMVEKANSKGFRTFQASATALPFKDESFDTTYSFKVLAHVPQIKTTLKEMERVTRKGGTVIAEFYNRQSFRWLRWALRKHYFHGWEKGKRIREKEVYTRYDTPAVMKSYLPPGLKLIDTRGFIVWSPWNGIFKIPLISKIFTFLEKKASQGSVRGFGGFFVLILEKTP
jgi:glycosyltransferase involved in cell wall biosynthesis/ubiquinone/menaquinone biosynthesis C-methylase UbiE